MMLLTCHNQESARLTLFVEERLSMRLATSATDQKHIYIKTSHKKFSEGKQVHVGMEASKTNQTRWE